MNNIFNKVKWFYKFVLGFVPERLPVGTTAFNAWVDDFIATYPMPTQNRDSIVWVLTSIIMRLGPHAAYRPKFYFYLAVHTAAAKQIAGDQFTQVKERQQAAIKAAQAEATAVQTGSVASDGLQK